MQPQTEHLVDLQFKNGNPVVVAFPSQSEALRYASAMAMDERVSWSSVRNLAQDAKEPKLELEALLDERKALERLKKWDKVEAKQREIDAFIQRYPELRK